MRLDYLLKRLGLFVLVVWVAATINFVLPRLSGGNAIRSQLLQQAAQGGFSTAIAFTLGILAGGLMAWPKTPKVITTVLLPPLLTLSAVPYYMLGLVLLWVFAFTTKLFPIFGAYTAGTIPDWSSPDFIKDVIWHMILPALSIVLSAVGFWALGMRAMMVTVQHDDFVQFADAKGLKSRTVFFRYAGRNALLPQVTALGLTIGHILSGALLVEIVFSYPGIGGVLYHSIRAYDYFAIEGIVFGVIVSITLATLVLDLIYPKIDPRITYGRS
jgi:peptide/nickel transport system permease protein